MARRAPQENGLHASVRSHGPQDAPTFTMVRGSLDTPMGSAGGPWGDGDLPSGADLGPFGAPIEGATAEEVVRWACDLFGPRLSLVCSFQNCVLIDLVTRVDPGADVIFLDTGSHFAETLAFVERIRALYDLNLRVVRPGADAHAWPCGSERCCELRKVLPLNAALEGRAAWMSGVKRAETPARASVPVVGWDVARALVKVNPLASWSYDDVARYEVDHDLPIHPLKGRGYFSIGCRPTTRPVALFEDPRAGRWPGTKKTECGLHITSPPGQDLGPIDTGG